MPVQELNESMISFKGATKLFPRPFFFLRHVLSYPNLEEIMEKQGVKINHAALSFRAVHYSTFLIA